MRLTPLPRLLLVCLGAALLSAGCSIPAQLAWSPDGSKAAYRVGDRAYLVDDQGHFLADLGTSMGGFAWANDGQALYYANTIPDTSRAGEAAPLAPASGHGLDAAVLGPGQPGYASPPPVAPEPLPPERRLTTDIETDWFAGPAPTPRDPQFNSGDETPSVSTVRVWRGEQPEDLFQLPDPVVYLQLSPDQQWLAAVTYHEVKTANEAQHWFGHYVYDLAAGRAHLLGWSGSWASAFTGPNRLAYVQPVPGVPVAGGDGQLVQFELNSSNARHRKLRRDTVVPLPGPAVWLRTVGDDLWMICMQRKTPGDSDDKDIASLYRLIGRTGGMERVAKDVGLLFVPSPDGQRILYAQGGDDSRLVVMSARGGSRRQIIDNWNGRALWPSWRTNDEIVVATTQPAQGDQPDEQGRVPFHAVIYRVTVDNRAEPLRNLSADWDRSRLPFEQRGQVRPATQPSTTQPTTTAPTETPPETPAAPVPPAEFAPRTAEPSRPLGPGAVGR